MGVVVWVWGCKCRGVCACMPFSFAFSSQVLPLFCMFMLKETTENQRSKSPQIFQLSSPENMHVYKMQLKWSSSITFQSSQSPASPILLPLQTQHRLSVLAGVCVSCFSMFTHWALLGFPSSVAVCETTVTCCCSIINRDFVFISCLFLCWIFPPAQQPKWQA